MFMTKHVYFPKSHNNPMVGNLMLWCLPKTYLFTCFLLPIFIPCRFPCGNHPELTQAACLSVFFWCGIFICVRVYVLKEEPFFWRSSNLNCDYVITLIVISNFTRYHTKIMCYNITYIINDLFNVESSIWWLQLTILMLTYLY